MDIRETLRILRRRWYITGPLLLLTVAGSAALSARSGPYQSESQVVLLPSAQTAKVAGGNPYLSFDDSVTLTADLLRRQLTAPPLVQSLGKNGYRSSYQVVDDPLTAGPVLDITVTGKSKSSVEHTLAGVTAEAARQLRVMQGHVAPIDRITMRTVSYDPKPSLLVSKKARTPLVALAIGLVLTIAVPLTLDAAVADRRKARARARSARSPATRAATIVAATRSRALALLQLARAALVKLARIGRVTLARIGRVTLAKAAQLTLATRTKADGRPGPRTDSVSSGAARGGLPPADDRLLADGHGEHRPGRTDGEHPTARALGQDSRVETDDASAAGDGTPAEANGHRPEADGDTAEDHQRTRSGSP